MNTFIFDIDGTLLDNVEGYLYGLQKLYAAMAAKSPLRT